MTFLSFYKKARHLQFLNQVTSPFTLWSYNQFWPYEYLLLETERNKSVYIHVTMSKTCAIGCPKLKPTNNVHHIPPQFTQITPFTEKSPVNGHMQIPLQVKLKPNSATATWLPPNSDFMDSTLRHTTHAFSILSYIPLLNCHSYLWHNW